MPSCFDEYGRLMMSCYVSHLAQWCELLWSKGNDAYGGNEQKLEATKPVVYGGDLNVVRPCPRKPSHACGAAEPGARVPAVPAGPIP
jgi:hypothetical protein